jgi:hypothetical protein
VEHAAEHLKAIYADYTTAERKAKRAAAYVRKDFSLEVFANRLDSVLGEIL